MKRRCRLYPCLGIGLIFIALSAPSMAQVQNASLTGLVADPSGAVVRSAMVTIKNSATNVTFTQETDASGYYFFPALPIGAYTVSVEMAGFKKAVHNIILEVGQRGRDDFHLEVGGITETVEVESAPSALETQQPAPNTVIQNRMVLEIPLSARNWDDLLQTVPGVAGDRYTEQGGSTAAGRTGGINVHGVRSLQNNFLLDGVDNNTVSENVQELSTQIVHTSVDAIEEFKVTTAPYSPEYGRSPGAAITVATKSGSNQVHGTAWEFLRNDKFDATDFFLNRSGVKKAKNRQNQFGGNIGGPIIRDRAFFFFNYEGTRIVRGQTRLTNVPTANERIGDFSSEAAAANRTTYANIFDNVGDCKQRVPSAFSPDDPLGSTHFANNKIPAACLDPVAQNVVALLPTPNLVPGTGPLNTNNYLRVPSLLDNNDSYTTKGDAQINARHHLFVRYVYSNRFRFVPGAFGGIIDGTGTSAFGRQDLKAHSAAIGHTWIINARMLNELRFGWGRNDSFAAQDPFGRNTLASIGILGVQDNPIYSGGLPGLSINGGGGVPQPASGGGLGRLGSPDFLPKFQKTNQFEESDTLSLTSGTHQFKFGVDLHLPMRNIYLDVPGLRGSWSFDGRFTGQPGNGIPWADYLLGYPQMAQLTNLHVTDARLWMAAFFFQDDWKATRKLTVNYGMRYDYSTWPYEGSSQLTNLDPSTGQIITPANSTFGDGLVKPDKNNFAPRLGLAYQLSDQWVVRAGYGHFYQLFERIGSEDAMSLNLPWLVNNVVSTSSRTAPANNMRIQSGFNLSLNPSALSPQTVKLRAVNPQSVMPSIDQWNLGLQHMLPGNMVFTMDYVGTKGTHLSLLRNLNQAPFNPDGTTTCSNTATCTTIPYPNLGAIGPIEYRDNMGNSSYHGLEASLNKTFSRGLSFHAAYTYSHSIDMVRDNLFGGTSASIVPNTYNVKGTNRGSSDFDFRHFFALTYVYEVPTLRSAPNGLRQILSDWRLTGVTTARTGRPFTIVANTNNGSLGNLGGLVTEYGDCLGSGNLPSDQRTVVKWFNTSAFATPPTRLGSCGRNTMTGPGLAQTDFNLTRSFNYFGEGRRLELRWDMLNAFNNTHFAPPVNDVSSGQFGQV